MSESRTSDKILRLSTAFTLEQRFKKDFEIVKKIGTGGFAKVYKARNLLDNSDYAVKKISLCMHNKSAKRIKEEIETVLNEIRLLAKIKNDSIVRYNHSWIEVEMKKAPRIHSTSNQNQANTNNKKYTSKLKKHICNFDSNFNNYSIESEDLNKFKNINSKQIHNDFLHFVLRDKEIDIIRHEEEKKDSYKNFDHEEEYKNIINKEKEDMKVIINGTSHRIKDIKKLKVFIQMELCKETLGDLLNKRNNPKQQKEMTMSDFFDLSGEDTEFYLNIFKKFAKAVDILHRESLIHRDLKPNNIFITEDGRVKVGDFGLATELFNLKYSKLSIDSDDLRKTSVDSWSDEMSKITFHTKNVGTPQYASPEQMNNNFYDQKSDIYSMGLILFETLYPFKTAMERHVVFKNLKEGNLPDKFIKNYDSKLSSLINQMCQINPEKRPNCQTVLNIIEEIINDIRNSKTKKTSRSRFLSESVVQSETYEILIKFIDDSFEGEEGTDEYSLVYSNNIYSSALPSEFNKTFVKLINDKLLILPHKDSTKAQFVYNLVECNIQVTKSGIEIDHPYMNKLILKFNESENPPKDYNYSVAGATNNNQKILSQLKGFI